MHSVNDPMTEARSLYVGQSRLGERLVAGRGEEFVIWDIGLGAAANAMAAIECFESLDGAVGQKRPLKVVSFENDLGALELALESGAFDYLYHPAPEVFLKKGYWERKGVRWQLQKGDFRDTLLRASLPDLIFYDPFSRNVEPELWSTEVFARLLDACGDRDVELLTYSSSTTVRVALLEAGFWVGAGRGSGPKEETTMAFTPLAVKRRGEAGLLDESWLGRFERSCARQPEQDRVVRAHPQFSRAQRISLHGGLIEKAALINPTWE
jgi:queuine tRNA-ribosyltransferase